MCKSHSRVKKIFWKLRKETFRGAVIPWLEKKLDIWHFLIWWNIIYHTKVIFYLMIFWRDINKSFPHQSIRVFLSYWHHKLEMIFIIKANNWETRLECETFWKGIGQIKHHSPTFTFFKKSWDFCTIRGVVMVNDCILTYFWRNVNISRHFLFFKVDFN